MLVFITVASHNHVRTSVGLFDVGHMVQSKYVVSFVARVSPIYANTVSLDHSILGESATEFLEWITPSSISSLDPYSSTLSVILNEKGGIIDDTIITKHAENAYYVVTNAGRRERDLAWFRDKISEWNNSPRASKGKVELEVLEGWGLVALQGISQCDIAKTVDDEF